MICRISDKFLAHGILLELALEFLPLGDEIIDETVDFLSVVLADIAEAHHVNIEHDARHNRCEREHQVDG